MQRRLPLLLGAIGLLQGVILFIATRFDTILETPPLAAALFVFGAVAGICLHLLWSDRNWLRLAILSLLPAALLALLAIPLWSSIQTTGPLIAEHARIDLFFGSAIVLLLLYLPLGKSLQQGGRGGFTYRAFFWNFWEILILGAILPILLLFFMVLTRMVSSLFSSIGDEIIAPLFVSDGFRWILFPLLYGVAIGLARRDRRVIDSVRGALIKVGRLTAPVLVAVLLGFIVLLLVQGLSAYFTQSRITVIFDVGIDLIGMVAVPLIFCGLLFLTLNIALADGKQMANYPRWLWFMMRIGAIGAVILPALILYRLIPNIQKYGLSLNRLWGLYATTLLAIYSVTWLIATVVRGGWPRIIFMGNLALASIVAVGAMAVNTPLLDPRRITADNQLSRILSGTIDPETADLSYLYHNLSIYGNRALEELERRDDYPNAEALHQEAAVARQDSTYYSYTEIRADNWNWETIPVYGEPVAATELIAAIEEANPYYLLPACDNGPCAIIGIDLNGDDAPEYCLIGPYPTVNEFEINCYASSLTAPQRIGNVIFSREGISADPAEVARLLAKGDFGVQPAIWSDIRIGEHIFSFNLWR